MPPRGTRTSLIALLAILAVAAVLRFAQLGSKPLWLDEAMTTLIGLGRGPSDVPIGSVRPLSAVSDIFTLAAGRGIGDVVRELRNPAVQHTHPPLYYALLHSWFAMHAPPRDSLAWWARAPSAIFGLLAVVLVYFLGRTVASERAAIVAASLAAVSPLMVMISQEARNYTLPLACVAAACWCLAALVHQSRDEQPTGPWLWIGWTTANILGCYAHYYVLLSVVAQAIALAVVAQRRPARQFYIPLAISSLAIGVAFLPWAGTFAAHTRTPEQGWMHESNPIRHLYSLLVALQAMLQGWPLDSSAPQFWWLAARVVIGIAIFAMIAVGAWRFLRGCDNPAATAMAWIAIITIAELLAASAFQRKNFAGEQRYHFVYYPPLVVLFGATLA